jgi:hypothetical protein
VGFLVTALAVAFLVGIFDALAFPWWARWRPLGAVVVSAVLTGWWTASSPLDGLVLVLGASFAGLALPSLLDAAVSRPTLTRSRPRL